MENTVFNIPKVPLHHIIKSNLVQYSNKILCPSLIDNLTSHIIETLECFSNIEELSKYKKIV